MELGLKSVIINNAYCAQIAENYTAIWMVDP